MLSQYTRNSRLMPARQIEQRRTNNTNVNLRPPNNAQSSFRSTSSSLSNSRFRSASLGSTHRQQQNNAASARLVVRRQNQQQQQQRSSFPAPNTEFECDFGGTEPSQLTQESSMYSRNSGSAPSVGSMPTRRNHATAPSSLSHISVGSRGGPTRPISAANSRLNSSLMSENSQFSVAPSSQTHRTGSYRPAPTNVTRVVHRQKPPNLTFSSSRANESFLQPIPASRKLEASRWMAPIEKEMLAFGPRPPTRRGRPVLPKKTNNNHPPSTLQSQSFHGTLSSQPHLVSAGASSTHRGPIPATAAAASQNLNSASAQSGSSSPRGPGPGRATSSLNTSSSHSADSFANLPPSLSLRQDSWEDSNSVAPNSSKTSAVSVSSVSMHSQRTTKNYSNSTEDVIIQASKEALIAELRQLFAEKEQQLVEVATKQKASINEQAAKQKASVCEELIHVKEQMNDEAKKQKASMCKHAEKLKSSLHLLETSAVESHDRRCQELEAKANAVDTKIEQASTILGAAEALVSKATQVASNLREHFVSTALPLIEKTVTTIVGKRRRSADKTAVTPTTTEIAERPSLIEPKKNAAKPKSKDRQHPSLRKTTTVTKLSPSQKTSAKARSTGKSKSVSKKTQRSKHLRDQSPFKPLDVIDNLHNLKEVHSSSSSSKKKKMSYASPTTHKSTVTPCKDVGLSHLHVSSAAYSSPVITKKRKSPGVITKKRKCPSDGNGDSAASFLHKPKRNSRSKKSRSTFATGRNKQQANLWDSDYDFLSQDNY